MNERGAVRTFQGAADRWSGVGPYYAMFPASFAEDIIAKFTEPGEGVLDPFAGRGTAVYSAVVQNRKAIGVEINPVGYVYAKAKLSPARMQDVEARLEDLSLEARQYFREATALPEFFQWCYAARVRRYLLAARAELDWRRSRIDRTVMALLLVYLHGKREAALSNQMRQTKALSPRYAVAWWKRRRLLPPDVEPLEFMKKRVAWRYAKGRPDGRSGRFYLGDSARVLPRVETRLNAGLIEPASLLLTSPPYFGITNYHYDQWLRLWLLGGPPHALRTGGGKRGKCEHQERYRELLKTVFERASRLLTDDATVYVRTDQRAFTRKTTIAVLREVFPEKSLRTRRRPFDSPTQTHLFGDKGAKEGELDVVLTS